MEPLLQVLEPWVPLISSGDYQCLVNLAIVVEELGFLPISELQLQLFFVVSHPSMALPASLGPAAL
jgi:hypothetical protein